MRRYLELAVGALCAIALSQFPAFHQQYLQRLGGHVDELTIQVEAIDGRAAALGMSRYDYIRALLDNPEAPARSEGENLADLVGRQVSLSQSLERLSTMSMLYVGPALVFEVEPQVAAATFRDFRPSVPLTPVGAGYTLFGFFLGYFGLKVLFALVLFPKRPVSPREARPRAE